MPMLHEGARQAGLVCRGSQAHDPGPESGPSRGRSRSRPAQRAQGSAHLDSPHTSGARELMRWDEPPCAGAGARRSIARALELAANPQGREWAAGEFDKAKLAATTKPVYQWHWRTIGKIFDAAGTTPLPMTAHKVDLLGGILKEAGYRSGSAFLLRYKRAHVEAGGVVSDLLHMQFKGALRAATRGLGPVRRAEAFSLQALCAIQDEGRAAGPGGPVAPGRFAIVGTWWLLREVEASLLRAGQVQDCRGLVTSDLSATTTDRPDAG